MNTTTAQPLPTRDTLTRLGIYVEDMEKEWGEAYKGNWRWMDRYSDHFGDICYSEAEAWAEAARDAIPG